MDYRSLFVLGRQPAIGMAELESVLGSSHVKPLNDQVMASDIMPADIDFKRLGGSVRLGKVLNILDTTTWSDIANYLAKNLPAHLDYLPEGKLKLGLSSIGLNVAPQQLMRTGLQLKKICKQKDRSVRLVPNTEPALSSAQVMHNQLTGQLGMELLLIKNANQTVLAQTLEVQDINAYAKRDQGRPKRDARVGMLPPKLAQIIVNLAVGDKPDQTVLDPFCGTGVVLQEAILMNFKAYGTDLEPRMIDFSRQNLEWLTTHLHANQQDPLLEVGDATTHQWQKIFSTIASEAYLGRPLAIWPAPDALNEIVGTCNLIIEKFLKNLASQTKPGFRLCLAVPAWIGKDRKIHLPLLDHLTDLGYNLNSFEFVKNEDLLYYRPNQIVARELLVITRK